MHATEMTNSAAKCANAQTTTPLLACTGANTKRGVTRPASHIPCAADVRVAASPSGVLSSMVR